jgi:hypothetical protein
MDEDMRRNQISQVKNNQVIIIEESDEDKIKD